MSMHTVINAYMFGGATVAATHVLVRRSGDTANTIGPYNVPWNAEEYDNGDWHDAVTNTSRLTVPSGVSLARVWSGLMTDGSTPRLLKNGSTFHGSALQRTLASVDYTNIVSGIIPVSSGDYFDVEVASLDVVVNDSPRTWFAAEVIDSATKYCRVRKSSNQAFAAASTFEVVSFDTEEADTDSFHDNVTNNSRLTVPSGVTLVRLSGSAKHANAGHEISVVIRKNGSTIVGSPLRDADSASANVCSVISPILEVTAGDYFEMFVATDAISESIAADVYTWLQIEEVPSAYKRCLAYRNTTQSLSGATWTPVQFNDEIYDTDSIHDNSTNNTRLVVPSGVTEARLTVGADGASNTSTFLLRGTKNGAFSGYGLPSDSNSTGGSDRLNAMGAWMAVTPGDYFEVEVWSGTARNLSANAWACLECR